MRVSTLSEDPGFIPGPYAGIRVFFNGYERNDVFTADDNLGVVVVPVRDKNGHFRLTANGDEVLKETLHGIVRIEFPEWHPLASVH